MVDITLLARTVFRWLLDFWKICAPPELYHFVEHPYARQTHFVIRVSLFPTYNESKRIFIREILHVKIK